MSSDDLHAWARRLAPFDGRRFAARYLGDDAESAARRAALQALLVDDTHDTLRAPDRDTAPTGLASTLPPNLLVEGPPPSARYTPGEVLGRGGVGAVFSAHDRLLRREVALKTLGAESQRSADGRLRFVYEACATGRLNHPSILPIHDLGALPDGRWFYTMPRLDGRSLRAAVDAVIAGEDPEFGLRRRMEILQRTCLTVAYAHDQGVMHRDLKPSNLMLGTYGEVYVIDWGLAKAPGMDDLPRSHDTAPGTLLGTLAYMSPEQISGDPQRIGLSTDVWSLGVILFELLTLKLPFSGGLPVRVMYAIVAGELPDPRQSAADVPEALAELCRAAMDRDPAARPSARSMAEQLGQWLDGIAERARREARAEALVERARTEADAWRAGSAALDEEAAALDDRFGALSPDTPMPAREALWAAGQALDERRLDVERAYARAVQAAESAIIEHPTDDAHRLLAALYRARAEAADARKQATTAVYFRALAAHHDPDTADAGLVAALSLSGPGAEQAVVIRQAPAGPLLRDTPQDGGPGTALTPGSYVVAVRAPGRMAVRVPLALRGGTARALHIEPPLAFPGHGAFAWVPGGRYPVGGDPEAPRGLPRQTVELTGFAIGRHPVTMAEYCAFLDALADKDGLDAARARSPRSSDGTVFFLDIDAAARRFSLPTADVDGDAIDPQWPVMGIHALDAEAYCAWLSHTTGAAHRLPTDVEWEVAARGVDRRLYPWGDGFDPVLCHMAESRAGRALPVPVGRYPHDRSPFGVCDMAGLVIEWTATEVTAGVRVQRGGAYTSPPAWCRATGRRLQRSDWATPQFGFRVLRPLTDGRVEGS